ncbi:MAG: hypothetical protein ACI8P3_002807 [Saprospiraceae bacterium]|jgi:hypothetical protein
MKQTVLLFIFTICSFSLFSQCVPNELYRDSAIGVYPPPLNMDNPDGGITESACINSPYEFVLTFNIPDNLSGIQLDSIVIEENGAVLNLPIGLDYACNPPNCVFTPADTIACLVILGTATEANGTGDYDLKIETIIYTGFGPQNITFPSLLIPGGDGNYYLTLHEEGNPDCTIVGTDDYITKNIRVTNSPNPFGASTTIEVYSEINERLDFRVFDFLGNVVHQSNVEIFEGENNFDFDGAHLANGIYTFSLSNKLGIITRKIVVSR